jgi:hypothetical protein
MFEEDNNELIHTDTTTDEYRPSPAVQKQILKLMSDEKAQRARTWSYYENIRQTDPTKYWSPKMQGQMHKDATALGEAFDDGEAND